MRALTRREFLGALAGTGPALMFPGCSQVSRHRETIPRLRRVAPILVDPHCHVFNGCDLPVRGFVRNVLLRDAGFRRAVAETAAHFLVQAGTPDFADENLILDGMLAGRPMRPMALGLEPSQPDFDEFVREVERRDAAEVDRLLHEDASGAPRARSRRERVDLLARTRLVSAYRWVRLLRKFRFQIVDELFQTYPDIELFTPALVDLDYGVSDHARTSIPEQIVLYEKLMRLHPGRLHAFVAFDPLREARHAETGDIPSLSWAQTAVRDRGFIGVKLYPPMGFQPLGNRDRAVEAALERLYDWAASEDVPLMAHCNDSNAAGEGFGRNASPQHWERVLGRWPTLRLSLGHLGGVDNFLAEEHRSWAWSIGTLMQRHPNVYADVGYHVIALDGGESQRDEYLRHVQELERQFPAAPNRILYGSDWGMIVLAGGAERYLTVYREAYEAVFGREAALNFAGGNALGYLGLDRDGAAGGRLRAFYAKHRIPEPAWLRA
jgi:predicted TIM-barrel fold metal-dependent hydrolase